MHQGSLERLYLVSLAPCLTVPATALPMLTESNNDKLSLRKGTPIIHESGFFSFCAHLTLAPWKKSYDKTRQHIKKQRHYFANKGPYSQRYGFSSSHVWMWELEHKESWALKNWCFWTVVLEKTLQSPLDCKEIQLVNPKGNQSWIFVERTDAEAETPILWPPDVKN